MITGEVLTGERSKCHNHPCLPPPPPLLTPAGPSGLVQVILPDAPPVGAAAAPVGGVENSCWLFAGSLQSPNDCCQQLMSPGNYAEPHTFRAAAFVPLPDAAGCSPFSARTPRTCTCAIAAQGGVEAPAAAEKPKLS